MNPFPKITIVTPVLNQATYLEKTILSVINQGYQNLEYIIIDGGSTDGSWEIIKKYSAKLAKHISEPDNGMYEAIQKGFDLSSGDIMGWINSDDLLAPNSLFTISEAFGLSPDIHWITGLPSTIDRNGRIVDVINARKWSKFNYLLRDCHVIQQESTFWTRILWEKSGGSFNQSYRYAGEFELWTRFFIQEKLFSVTTMIGCFRKRSDEQISLKFAHQYSEEVDSALHAMDELFNNCTILKEIKAYNQFKALLKIPIIYKRYLNLFQYPPIITYDFTNNKLILV